MADQNLEEIVRNAADGAEAEGEENLEVEGAEGEENEEAEGEGEEAESPEDIAEAKRIYKLLKDPKTATSLVRELARAEGLLAADVTPREIKAGKATIKDILKEKLGDKYDFLTPALAEAFETILAGERETQQENINQIKVDATKRETADVLAKLAKETKGESRKVETQMLALMDEFQIGPGVSIEKYLRGLYAQASSARTAQNAKNQNNDRIRRNANDAPSRLQTSSGAESNDRGSTPAGVDPKKPMSLKEAVDFAVSQQTRQGTRK